MSERIDELSKAVETNHNCKATYLGSVQVTEMDGLRKVWNGVVEIFQLSGHLEAKICYGWRDFDGHDVACVTVLEIPPVISPQAAVRAAIARAKQE